MFLWVGGSKCFFGFCFVNKYYIVLWSYRYCWPQHLQTADVGFSLPMWKGWMHGKLDFTPGSSCLYGKSTKWCVCLLKGRPSSVGRGLDLINWLLCWQEGPKLSSLCPRSKVCLLFLPCFFLFCLFFFWCGFLSLLGLGHLFLLFADMLINLKPL